TKKLLVRFITTSILPLSLLMLSIQTSSAGSATWLALPVDNDWNNSANSTLGGPPNGPSDTDTFSFSTGTDVSVFANTDVDGVTFDAAASPYTITVTYPDGILTMNGAGITNNSDVTQSFLVHGQLFLQNNAIVGDSVSMETGSGGVGYVQFSG